MGQLEKRSAHAANFSSIFSHIIEKSLGSFNREISTMRVINFHTTEIERKIRAIH